MSGDEAVPITAIDLKTHFDEFKESFTYDLNLFKEAFTLSARNEISNSVRSEVSAVIGPLHKNQLELRTDLETTKQQISYFLNEQRLTQSKLNEIENRLHSNQSYTNGGSAHNLAPPLQSARSTVSFVQPASLHNASLGQVESQASPSNALNVLREAKRILGFSPITPESINVLKQNYSINDHDECLKISILNFLHVEMKVPEQIYNSLEIVRIFPPAHKSDWNTLYVVFKDALTVELLNQ